MIDHESSAERNGRVHYAEVWHQQLRDVEVHRRLIGPHAQSMGFLEFLTADGNRRYIALTADSGQALLHERLLENRLPVFSTIYADRSLFLDIPLEAKSLRSIAHMLPRDIAGYSEILRRAGVVMHELSKSEFGLPQPTGERTILSTVAYSLNPQDPYGMQLNLVPPYELSSSVSCQEITELIRGELANEQLSQDNIATLVGCFAEGWQ